MSDSPTTDPDATDPDAIEQLADSFVARLRAGQRPSIEQYVRRYPQLADEVRQLLPALVLLEQNASANDAMGASAGVADAAPAPREIGEFTIIRELGRGGMGVVYEAIQQSLGRHVALKVLSTPGLLNPTHLERFRLEARAAARLHHTHIVPVFGVGECDGLHYYVMQFIAGQSLDLVINELRRIRRREGLNPTVADATCEPTRAAADGLLSGQFPVADPGGTDGQVSTSGVAAATGEFTSSGGRGFYHSVARVGLNVADALAYAHAQGILHRDVKPSNLLLDAQGNVWITDFGLAKDEAVDALTQTGDLVGTLRYMPPERIDGWSDPRSDLYSLGATLYELLTLEPFLEDSSRGKLVERIFYEAPAPPSKFDAKVPSDLETIVLKATAKEPADRYRTAADMAEDLRRFLVDRPILARRSTPSERLLRWCRRNPLVAALVGAVAALAVAAVAILAVSNARIRSESAARAIALDEKGAALATAREAINQMLTRTANEAFADAPRLHPVRVALLTDAVRFYEALAANPGADPSLKHEMAGVLQVKAGLERETDQHGAAVQSLQRCIALLESLLPTDPEPPQYLEQLAIAQRDLGLTLFFQHEAAHSCYPLVDAQYRKALALFDELERRWPDRLQPVALCVRYLGFFASHRGENEEAERLFRAALHRGEAYCQRYPADESELHETAWACVTYSEFLMNAERLDEAVAIARRGLRHVEAPLEDDPESTQAIDVASVLRMRLALCYCRQDRGADAVPVFQRTIRDMQGLCEAFPWNDYYWGSLHWFHEEMATTLRATGRADDASQMLRDYRAWLQRIATSLPDDPGPQEKLWDAQAKLVELLRAAGLERDSDALAEFIEAAR